MLYTFYALITLLILQGIVSLLEGFRYVAYVRRSLATLPVVFTPKTSIIAPCKGVDTGMEGNLRALFHQDYPSYEILFAVGSREDAALPVIERIIDEQRIASAQKTPARVVIATPNDSRSEKVNNLLSAIDRIAPDSEVFVFVDSDARVTSDWLRSLVAPLVDKQTGAATGYRWYLPERGGFFSALLSAWNGSVATTLGDHNRNFAWGGSTAIRRETFAQCKVHDAWQQAVSDDYALTNAVQKSGLQIRFVPQCLTISREDATLPSLLEFTTRQVIITRVYNARLWWIGLVSQVLFNAVFFGGLAFAVIGALLGKNTILASLLLTLIYLLGSAKGLLRLIAAREMLSQAKAEITRLWWMYCLLWILVSPVYLFNFVKSATTRRILWRGVLYEMRSPQETIVIGR
jgi:ceramide glucosyltransferase